MLGELLESYTEEGEDELTHPVTNGKDAVIPVDVVEEEKKTDKKEVVAAAVEKPMPEREKIVPEEVKMKPPVAVVLEIESMAAFVDYGTLTEVGKVPIIDDEYSVRVAIQKISLDRLVKGQRVKYSYVEKDDMRKDIVILECLAADEKKPPVSATPVVNVPKVPETSPPLTVQKPSAIKVPVVPVLAGQSDDYLQWRGQVIMVRTKDDKQVIEVHFENGNREVISLDEEICDPVYQPAADDTIIALITEPGDDPEDDEADDNFDEGPRIRKIQPAELNFGGGTVKELHEKYGVINEDVYFTDIGEGYEVGTYLEYTVVPCKRDDFKWRCLSTQKAVKLDREARDEINREYLDNPVNYTDHEGLAVLNRDELAFRMFVVDQEMEKKIVFANKSDKSYRLLNLYFTSPKGRPQVRLKSNWGSVNILPHSTLEVRIVAKGRFICNYEECAIALFNRDMVLCTPVRIAVGSDDLIRSANMRDLAYKATRIKVKYDAPKADTTSQIFKVSRPSRKFVEVRIESYRVPDLMWQFMCMEPREFEEKCLEEHPFLGEPLSAFNYKEWLHQMVYISEAHLRKCFRVYDLYGQQFEKEYDGALECNVYYLKLEGLAESRPSVLQEDTMVAKEGGNIFTGIIKRIKPDKVGFQFHEQFEEAHLQKRYDVTFHYSRSPFMKLHHGLDEMVKKFNEEFLFPDAVVEKPPLLDVSYDCEEEESSPEKRRAPMKLRKPCGEVEEVPWHNQDLNWHQKRVIVNALRAECRPMPYLICGPPGTGKTSTLVELVLQQFLNNNQATILICTPSNSAGNLILDKLVQSDQILIAQLARVIGFQAKEREMVPEEMLKYCATVEKSKKGTEGRKMTIMENGMRLDCQMEDLCDFRVIIVTTGSVGTFMEMGFPDGHFTHLFVDEAGQCLETEMLVPMSLLNREGHFVFVGDEQQLGPVVQFKPLARWGYGVSLFERLQQLPMYNRNDPENYDPRLCYQLVNNYRALPTILKLYNKLFYKDTLQPMVRVTFILTGMDWKLTFLSLSLRSSTNPKWSTTCCVQSPLSSPCPRIAPRMRRCFSRPPRLPVGERNSILRGSIQKRLELL